jgi:hypothetical protein
MFLGIKFRQESRKFYIVGLKQEDWLLSPEIRDPLAGLCLGVYFGVFRVLSF